MSGVKRPKLNQVFKGAEGEASPPTAKPAPSKADMVQLNVTVSGTLRRAARVKALQEGRELASVVRELLQRWVEEEQD